MAKVIRQKQVELQAAIVASGEVKLLASKMNAAGLMSNKDHDEITGFKTWWTDGERAESVVKILRNKVDIKPSNLEKFKDILKSKSEFEDILDLLETTAPEGLIRRPQRSRQDAHLGNGSNEERETVRSFAPSPSVNPKNKFKDKRNPYGFLMMIILAGVTAGVIYFILTINATTGSSVQEEPSANPTTTPTEPRKVQPHGHRIKNLKDLISATEEFGDWYGLCLSLKVEQAVMNQLDESTETSVKKMRRCLTNYFNNRIPLWDDVVRAIAELHNKRLACRIAMKHMQWGEKDCGVELSM